MATASTPIARSKSAALARVLDSLPKGYDRYLVGTVPAAKATALASKFHRLYEIGCTPARRVTRKARGQANCLLIMYWPTTGAENDVETDAEATARTTAARVDWLILATDGDGLEAEARNLHQIDGRGRLVWLGYELVKRPERGRTAWTWRRTKAEMEDLHNLLARQINLRLHNAVGQTLARIARQPGFHGVREQSWRLCQFARSKGYAGELPTLYYLPKISHGERLILPGV
ncbi:hypothetical protein KVP10_12355 [Candidimonas humi]|uniref:Uncharacterized protein n=1 Tax=Candidimonas humi TaxID=683355 RepID=A0ABV8P0Z1_9BURK|nr:hypothetical protein [Candidimonas humi]MBV6305681.1 hypothetical protein [Candidimonas humi]